MKLEIGILLDEAEQIGAQAYRVAVSLLSSGLSYDEILDAARKAPAGPPSNAIHYQHPDAQMLLLSMPPYGIGLYRIE
jgi:hypothetical protein